MQSSDDLLLMTPMVPPKQLSSVSFRLKKSVPKARPPSTDNPRESKEILLREIEKKLQFRDNTSHFAHQQVLCAFLTFHRFFFI